MKAAEPGRRPLTAIVVDDERLARKDLVAMLARHPIIQVVGEADDARSAARLIARLDPDVVFLDIQMPGESGLDLLERIEVKSRIVFVTAYDQYALRAFEVSALDYLLKPVSTERLAKSVERLAAAGREEQSGAGKLGPDDSLFIRIDSAMRFLKVGAILAITAAGDYSEVVTTAKRRGLTDKSMNEWEARLPAAGFCRIHRSAIVNLAFIDRVEAAPGCSHQVVLRGLDRPLPMSRRHASRLKRHLK
jgi:two-component system LytT family response regulator